MSDCSSSGDSSLSAVRIPTSTPSGGEGFVRSIRWVDLRIGPGGDGTELNPYDTVAVGLTAIPNGGTLMVVGGDASGEDAYSLGSKSATIRGLSGQDDEGGRTVELPLLEYAISTGTQELSFHDVSVVLSHTGADNNLTELHFRHCPSVSLLADGDAPTVHWVGDDTSAFAGSGGPAYFERGTIGGYTANGSSAVTLVDVSITGNVSSSSTITIRNACSFGAGVTITSSDISIDPASYRAAIVAGVTFSSTPFVYADFRGGTTGYVLTKQANGEWVGASGGGGFSLPGGGKAGQVLESDGAGGAVWATDDTGSAISLNTDRLMGRDTAGTGNFEEITVGGGIEFTGSLGIQTSAFTGDVTKSAGGTALTIANNAVTDAKFRDSAAYSVIGRAAGTGGDPADIVAGTDTVLGRDGSANVAFTQVQTGMIANGAVTTIKLGNIASDRLWGRDTPATGAIEELTVGGGLEFTGAGGIQSSAYTGDVTKTAGGTALTIANDAVTYAKLQNVAGMSVVGRASNSSGDAADITAANDNEVFRRSGTTIGFGTIATGGISNSAVTLAKLQDISTDRLLGRDTAATGAVEQISVGGGIEFTGSLSLQLSAFTGDVTKSAGGTALTIANDAVTYAKMQNVSATSRILGRVTAGAGDVEELTGTQVTGILAAPGSTTQVIYNNGGAFDAASGITVVGSETALAFGATPAGADAIRLANNMGLRARNAANSADLLLVRCDTSDNVLLGSTSTGGDTYLDAASGKTLWIRFAGAPADYRFTSTFADFTDNSLQFGTNPASAGMIRGPNNALLLAARNAANSGDVGALSVDSANHVVLGSTGSTTNYHNVATAGSHIFQINSADEYTFTSTGADFKENFLQFGTNPSAQGAIRFPASSGGHGVWWRNNANSADIAGIFSGTDDVMYIGDSTNSVAMNLRVKTGGSVNVLTNGNARIIIDSAGGSGNEPRIRFSNSDSAPAWWMAPDASSASSDTTRRQLTIQGQNKSGTGTEVIGGTVALLGGDVSGAASTTRGGMVRVQGGTISAGTVKWGGPLWLGGGASTSSVRTGNVYIGTTFDPDTFDWQTMGRGIFVQDAASPPFGDPVGGGFLFSESGALKWRSPSGTISTPGPAEPHCPRCDRDFAHEFENKRYGKLAVCVSCLVDALDRHGIAESEWVIERRAA